MSIQLPHAIGSPLFRSWLADAVSATRRTRPKLPFWKLQAHRLPTLHLYRSLLRLAPTENIYFRIGLLFRENRHLTSTKEVTKVLLQAYRLQETLATAKSEERTQKLVERYDRLIQGKRSRARCLEQEQNEIDWRRKMLNRPIMTGGFMHATLYNGPLPRLKPQPDHITGLIRFRRKKYITKFAKQREIKEALKQMNFEAQFEAKLINEPMKQIYAAYVNEWTAPIKAEHARITAWFEACYRRCQTPIPQSLFDQVIQARREKIINKAKQRVRERKGEVLRSTIQRRRQGPPAHVLAQLSPKCKEEDKHVRRGVSEVGYLGMLKARKGFALKRRDGETKETKQGTMRWSVEEGRWISDEIQQITKDRWKAIQQENRRRRGENSA